MSSRTRRSQGQEWSSTDAEQSLPSTDESAFSWGNGFMASELRSSGGGGPDDTGTLSEGFFDLGRQLGSSHTGTHNAWQRMDAQDHGWDSFYASGLGAGYGGGAWGDHGGFSTGFGGGLGGGGGHWQQQSVGRDGTPRRSAEGYGGGLGGMLRGDQRWGLLGQEFGGGGELYRGAGGNAYGFRDENLGRQGYGIDGNWTPVGINNAYGDWDTALGSGNASMENAGINRRSGSLEGYRTDAGGYGLQGSYANRTEFSGIHGHSDTFLGDTDASIGEIGRGARYQGGVEVGPDGSVMGHYQRRGSPGSTSFSFKDVNVAHDFGDGVGVDGHLGRWGGNSGLDVYGGWNNTTDRIEGRGSWSAGRRLEDASLNFHGPGGYESHAGIGSWENGNGVDIESATLGADGLHARGSGYWGGMDMTDLSASGGWRGSWFNEAQVGELSNRSTLDGGYLDIDGQGVRAGFDEIRAIRGWQAKDISAHNELLGMNTDLSIGEVSNDYLLEGGSLNVDSTGIHAGLRNFDGGGVRVNDARLHSDLGGYGSADAHLGSFSNTQGVQGARLDLGQDGLHAGVDRWSLNGMTIDDAGYDVQGPGGLHSSASLRHLQTGFNGQGARLDVTEDGLSAGIDQFQYDRLAFQDLHARGGIDGIYESQLDIGDGRYMSGGADNLQLGIDGNGARFGADNARFNYLALEDAHLGSSYFDGALGQSIDIGHGSYLGGSAGHIDYQTDFLDSSLAIDDLNAHGLQLGDTHLRANVGDANAHLGARELNVLDLNAGHLEGHTQNMGLQGQFGVQDARLDLVQADDLGADIGWGDTTLLGARTDLDSSLGVRDASGEYDLLAGTASGRFEDANVRQMLDDTHLEAFGYGLDVGRTGFDVHASGAGNVDLAAGRADGNVNLAGTELALFGNSVTLGDWAQASGALDVSQGAASVNVGGENGVGADVNLSQGNVDLHAFGGTWDVDETARDIYDGAAGLVSDAGSAISSGWDSATSAIGSVFSGW